MRGVLVFLLFLAASPIDAAQPCPRRDSSARGLAVTVQIHDYEHLPTEYLVRASEIVSQLYERIGVQIEWFGVHRRKGGRTESTTNDSPRRDGPAAQMTVMIVTPEMAARGRIPKDILGYAAVPPDGGPGRIAYVLYDRVRPVAEQSPADLVELLGFVIAHETGHLLLGRGSASKNGLMRCHWELRDMRNFVALKLGFSDLQAGRIRNTVINGNATELLASRDPGNAGSCVTRTDADETVR